MTVPAAGGADAPARLTIGMIWAQARGGVIGADGTMPWRLPEDLAHFKSVTSGHTVIMGRATWDSIPSRFRPLPGRRNIVLTRDSSWTAEGAEAAHSTEQALALARSGADEAGGEVWVTGGAQIYRAMLPHADVCVVTDIDTAVDGDTLAPELDNGWAPGSGQDCEPGDGGPALRGAIRDEAGPDGTEWLFSERTGLRYRFRVLRRVPTSE